MAYGGKMKSSAMDPPGTPNGEMGQGKETGHLEGTQAWDPKDHEQSWVDARQFRFTRFERLCSVPGLQLSLGNVPRGEAILQLL